MVSDLDKIEFHDLPLESLVLDFPKENLVMLVSKYNEVTQDYLDIEITFSKVSNVYISKMEYFESIEIASCDYGYKNNVNFISFLLLDFSHRAAGPPVNLCFEFNDVNVVFGS